VKLVVFETPFSDAPIEVVPAPTADASPPDEIVATAGADDVHVTLVVIFRTEPSSYVPCATNCRVLPAAAEDPAGLIAIVCSFTAAPIVTRIVLVTPLYVHVIVVVPAATAVIMPLWLTVATDGSDDVHVAFDVTFSVCPSASTAIAVSCADAPTVTGPVTCPANERSTASTFDGPGPLDWLVLPHPAIPLSATASTVKKIRKLFFTGRSWLL
jgi:hypothetical protein